MGIKETKITRLVHYSPTYYAPVEKKMIILEQNINQYVEKHQEHLKLQASEREHVNYN